MLGVGAGLDRALGAGSSGTDEPLKRAVPFFGGHQSGIATPSQDYMHFAAFDIAGNSLADLRGVLERWTKAAAQLTAGQPYAGERRAPSLPPQDPGETVGLGPAQLTITIGFGPSMFDSDRFGLGARRPAELQPLPPFQGDRLDPARSGGDLAVQACADDPQVAFHAIHLLTRLAGSAARLRWTQLGFGRTSNITRSQSTPRNLMGFKDGTNNIRAEDTAAMDRYVWVQPADGPDWMTGGTYLVARRIKILLDAWDATSLQAQERAIGRDKLTGAPLGRRGEYDPVDLSAIDNEGKATIPNTAHIRIANPQNNAGERILRRGFSYSEGTVAGTGEIDAGLFFIAFQRSPTQQFIPLQNRLAAFDALSRHTLHTASAIFACPPAAAKGGFIGDALLT